MASAWTPLPELTSAPFPVSSGYYNAIWLSTALKAAVRSVACTRDAFFHVRVAIHCTFDLFLEATVAGCQSGRVHQPDTD